MSSKDRIDSLSPTEKRALLEQLLKQRAAGIQRRAPLSFAQRRMWLLHELDRNGSRFNLQLALRLCGAVSAEALQSALAAIVDRHEILRTRFEAAGGVPEQIVHHSAPVELRQVDLSSIAPEQRELECARLRAAERQRAFDLAAAQPLVRAILFLYSPNEAVLSLTAHHIIFDGWSFGVLIRELALHYNAIKSGGSAYLPALPQQYIDAAARQTDAASSADFRRQLDYWRQCLTDMPPPLQLPWDGPRGSSESKSVAESVSLSEEVLQELKTVCKSVGATPFMGILMLLQVLLQRMSGTDDIVVGSPVAGRNAPGTEGLIGFFVNMLVLRADLGGELTFRDALIRVRDVVRGGLEHQDVPFERLLEELNPERYLGSSPLFQVYVNMLNVRDPDVPFDGMEVRSLPFEPDANFDLVVYIREEGGGLDLIMVCPDGVFSRVRLREMLRQFHSLAEAAVRRFDSPVSAASLVTTQSAAVLPDPKTPLMSKIESSSLSLCLPKLGQHGARPAIVAELRGVVSYEELDANANRIARWLLMRGLRRGEVVAVLAGRDPLLVAALLGIVRAGAAFAILDSAYPDESLAQRWRAAEPRGLVLLGEATRCGPELAAAIREASVRLELRLDPATFDALTAEPCELPDVGPDDLAYIAFTSGTTGGVKAIEGTHGPVAHFLSWQQRTFALSSDERFSLLAGLAHDPLLRDVFAPLWCGAQLHVPSPDTWSDPTRLSTWLRVQRISVTHLTPAIGELIGLGSQEPAPHWRYAFFGGDVLTRDVVQAIWRIAPNAVCVNFYGATETPQAMGYCVIERTEAPRERLPLGRGIDAVQLLVLGADDRLAGIGELGEIVVRTPFLSRGYRDARLTRERFGSNPLTRAADDRIYRTGDLGRYSPDGNVEFAGRRDGQIKLRGFRIELGEVEAALRAHPEVAAAVAVVRLGDADEGHLVGYVVGKRAGAPDASTLRSFLERKLPAYAVPASFMALPALPLTPNGKVDRRALPAPSRSALLDPLDVLQTPREQLVAQVFEEVLARGPIGRRDRFFDLGGHSLLAAQVVARLNERLQLGLSLRMLFERPSVAELAAGIDDFGTPDTGVPGVRPRVPGEEAGLSFAQERLWFLNRMAPDSAAFNLAGALELNGELDTQRLKFALETIALRHEALRTTFPEVAGQPVQRVSPTPLHVFSIISKRGAEKPDVLALIRRHAAEPFDLSQGPLVRAVLIELAHERHVLLLVCHHIVSDGWSMGVFVKELGLIYNAFHSGQTGLPPLPLQYGDYSQWQRSWLQGDRLQEQVDYWRGKLAGAPPHLELPTDRPRPAVAGYDGARHSFEIPRTSRDRLAELARAAGATPFMALLTAFQVLIGRYTGVWDVVVGSPVANRTRPAFEGLIGFFVNTLLLRNVLEPSTGFGAALAAARDTCLEAFAHQELPFAKLVEELRPVRDASRNPLFQVMFVLQNMPIPPLRLEGLQILPVVDLERSGAQVDLTLYLRETENGLAATFEYATGLFDAATIERMAEHYCRVLVAVAETPNLEIARLKLIGSSERRRVIEEWNRTAEPLTGDGTVVDMIAAQVSRRRGAIAVRGADPEMTYAELDAAANRVARHLLALGVGNGSLVAVCLERTARLPMVLLGVLKCGAAYVPLDPAFPSDRLSFMLADSGAEALIVDAATASRLAPPSPTRVVDLDGDRVAIEQQLTEPPTVTPQPTDRAYVIYTSGSTGRPKGVEIEHRALRNFLQSMSIEPGLAEHDVLVAVTTVSFDIAALELLLPLTVGACIVLANRETAADPERLSRLLSESNATVMQATPSTWRMLLEAGWSGSSRLKALCGGEALGKDLALRLLPVCSELWNLYGPTETTIWSSAARIESADDISIGRPIANTQIYVLDERLEPVPTGVVGELWIGGRGVARGYLNRPELTAERFVANPFHDGRMYRTGDLARRSVNGRLECLGRADSQVKIRGYRIELGEIESVLNGQPGVVECAVVAREIEGDRRLIAYVVGIVDMDGLRAALRVQLPDYMIPAVFVPMETLPRTPNNKIDRNGLVAPADRQLVSRSSYDPPRTATEQRVAEAFERVLSVQSVGRGHNFFELGGHSLLITKVATYLREQLGVDLPIRAVFETPTVAGLAHYVDVVLWSAGASAEEPAASDEDRVRVTL